MFFCLFVWFNIVIGHLSRPYSTHTAPVPVRTGSVHAHILTKHSRAGFAVIRLELIEPGAATCVHNEARPRERSDRFRFLGMPGMFLKSLDSCIYIYHKKKYMKYSKVLFIPTRYRRNIRENWKALTWGKAEGTKRSRPFSAFRQKSLFIAGRTSIGCQK